MACEGGVILVGPASLQNKLLARLIGEGTGYLCEVRVPEQPVGEVLAGRLLLLLDAGECGARLASLSASGLYPEIAVINADPAAAWDGYIGYPGVKGIFGADVSEPQFIKGIEAIFAGEYWLPRRLLCAHLERTRERADGPAPTPAGVLTRKEVATLRLLAAGNSTEHIASALKVSPHTVKTHIYNLFRKIHVSNRVQAVHWAAQHMVIADLRSLR